MSPNLVALAAIALAVLGIAAWLTMRETAEDRSLRARLATFCLERLAGASYPLARFYREIARSAEVT